jgi:platelet-activating factor acetylhydrolase
MYNKLPSYRGPLSVGFTDIDSVPKIEVAKREQGLFFRLYYPTDQNTRYSSWLPNKWDYAAGYGNFLKSSMAAIMLLHYPFLSLVRKPATENAPLKDLGTLPICIFSHGLAGMRTTYSNLCGNLASRGVFVAAIEHGDGSACFTSRPGSNLKIPHYHPYPDDINEGESEKEYLLRLRTSQLDVRRDEILEAVKLITELHQGNLSNIVNGEKKLLQTFADRFNMDNMFVMGHSFGV